VKQVLLEDSVSLNTLFQVMPIRPFRTTSFQPLHTPLCAEDATLELRKRGFHNEELSSSEGSGMGLTVRQVHKIKLSSTLLMGSDCRPLAAMTGQVLGIYSRLRYLLHVEPQMLSSPVYAPYPGTDDPVGSWHVCARLKHRYGMP